MAPLPFIRIVSDSPFADPLAPERHRLATMRTTMSSECHGPRLGRSTALLLTLAFIVGCTGPGTESPDADDTSVVEVGLTVATVNALPKCTTALGGTTALVTTPQLSLWTCGAGAWLPIPCTRLNGGTV